jgi:hypothetical protein
MEEPKVVLDVLDIDLDAFLNDTSHWRSGNKRLNKKNYFPWDEQRLRNYLEQNCNLSTARRIPGFFAVEHDQAFDYFLQLSKHHNTKLNIVHLDGHADLGLGDPSWIELITKYLLLTQTEKENPPRGRRGCNPGSYLAYAAAAEIIQSIVYAYPPRGGNDLHTIFFKNNDIESNQLVLKAFDKSVVSGLNYENLTDDLAILKMEPIDFHRCPIESYKANCAFDYLFFCQSPAFTPKTSDRLLKVIGEYVTLDPASEKIPSAD